MKIALHVQGSPYTSQAAHSALLFAKSALSSGHEIPRVFFSNLGVLNATTLAVPPQDEIDLHAEWVKLAADHKVELITCISAALRHGILDENEADRYEKTQHNVEAPFVISGLGQLTEAAIECDRVVTFAS